jgi:hypothetical protein
MSASAALLLLSGYYYLPTRVGELIYAGFDGRDSPGTVASDAPAEGLSDYTESASHRRASDRWPRNPLAHILRPRTDVRCITRVKAALQK